MAQYYKMVQEPLLVVVIAQSVQRRVTGFDSLQRQQRLDLLWDPLSPLSSGYQGLFPLE